MSNLSSASPIGPLSVGNVVNAGIRVYRSHLKRYLTLSIVAYLWLLVPIYGWAKFSSINGLISRLAFQELINQPESVEEGRLHTNARMWSFLGAGILVFLIFLGLYIALLLGWVILAAIGGMLVAAVPALSILLALLGVVAGLYVLIRFYSRLLLVEVPLAIEDNLGASSAISRSWNLTKGSIGKIQWIVIVAFLISLVVQIPTQVLSAILPTDRVNPSVAAISGLLVLIISLLSGALIMPFWQVIKAVIYYDLRVRKEGLGLQLRPPTSEDW
jgi:hypothetical protein